MSEDNKNLPVFKVSCGAVEAAVWAMKTEHGVLHSVTSHRNYKNKDGDWAKTQSYNISDIANLKYCLDECFKFSRITSKIKKEQ